MDNKNLFVWDFHGVLEKGNVYAVQKLVNLVLKKFDINKEITIKEAIDWYGLSWFDYFKLATPEGNHQLWQNMVNKVLLLQEESWNIIKENIKVRDFAEETLNTIKEKGHQNIILSNTQPEHISSFTDFLGLTQYFDNIIGVDNHYKSRIGNKEIHDIKSEVLTNFLKEKEYTKVIVIGDKESDIKAGKNCRATTYLFIDKEPNEDLKNKEADYVISDLREILKELEF